MLKDMEELKILKSEVRSVLDKMNRYKAADIRWECNRNAFSLRLFWYGQNHRSNKQNI